MADFTISSLPSETLTSDTLLLGSMPDGLGGYDSGKFDAQAISGIVVKYMKQTDYDDLSSAEKKNGTLYITDGTPPSETVTGSDVLYFSDVSDSDKPKSTTATAVAESAYTITTSTDSNTGVTWTAKKYNNGDLEIWGNKYYTPDSEITFGSWGSIYSTLFTVGTYPIEFYSTPCVIGQVQIEQIGSVSSVQATPGSTTTAPQIAAVRGTAGTIATTYHINISLYARGRWKE